VGGVRYIGGARARADVWLSPEIEPRWIVEIETRSGMTVEIDRRDLRRAEIEPRSPRSG